MTTQQPSEPLSDERLAGIAKRIQAATPGPWMRWDAYHLTYPMGERRGQPSRDVAMARLGPAPTAANVGLGITATVAHADIRMLEDDAEFIAYARADIPALLAEVERLRAREAALMEIARAVATLWVVDDCSNGYTFPQRRVYLCDGATGEDGTPAIDVAALHEQARALLASTEQPDGAAE